MWKSERWFNSPGTKPNIKQQFQWSKLEARVSGRTIGKIINIIIIIITASNLVEPLFCDWTNERVQATDSVYNHGEL